jgi:hypothetical protein
MTPSYDHEVGAVHGDGVADAGDATRRQAEHLDPGAHAQQLERTQIWRIGIELVAGGVAHHDRDLPHRRRSQSEPHWAANAQAADSTVKRRAISSSVGSSTSSTDRSTERSASAASIAPSARSRSYETSAPSREFVSATSPSRAREIAEEIDSPSWRASRSDATSPCVNSRCFPGDRCGLGKPNLRSQARNVFGLTFSNAAASLVLR